MKINKITIDKTCDCGNKADYQISHKHKIINFKIYLCSQCVDKLYKEIGQNIIPTSPINILKKSIKY